MYKEIENTLQQIKKTKPLIFNLTNFVTMDFIANCLLSLGAAPIMSLSQEEMEELIKISHSININIGTLDKNFIKKCHLAVEISSSYQKPIILDPVGAGASLIRTNTAKSLIKNANIIRGNASEIMAIAESPHNSLGVESANTTKEAKNAALSLANQYNCTVVVSGPIDYITDGEKEIDIPYGSNLMQYVTGMGCALSAVIAAFKSILKNDFKCSVLAVQYFGLCGELAAAKAHYPGSFRTVFIDILHESNFENLIKEKNEI